MEIITVDSFCVCYRLLEIQGRWLEFKQIEASMM